MFFIVPIVNIFFPFYLLRPQCEMNLLIKKSVIPAGGGSMEDNVNGFRRFSVYTGMNGLPTLTLIGH